MVVDPVFVAKEKVLNRFLLSVVAFERSKQLIKGARPRTERKSPSNVTMALQEIAEGHVIPSTDDFHWKLN